MQQAALAIILLTPMTGMLGVEVVNLRMAFFSDAIGHSSFAGLAIGIALALPPRTSMLAFAVLAGWAIVFMCQRKKMSADNATGIIFSAIIAIGLIFLSREPGLARSDTLFLYGDILTIGEEDICVLAILSAVMAAFHFFGYNPLLHIAISSDLAKVAGERIIFWQYSFAALLSVTVIFSVWAVGILLVTALLVVPASAARNFSSSAGTMFWWSILISLTSGLAGLILSAQEWLAASTGATIIIVSCSWFLASLVAANMRRI